jgi:hypothetical protein
VKVCVYNDRLELQIEIRQRYVVSDLHRRGMKLPEIVAELASVYREEAFDENRVKYWLHKVELRRFDFSDRPSSGKPSLEDTDAQQLLDVLKAQEKCHFRDMITGDETWVYFDMKPRAV